jgi:hypothetical protein
MPQLFAAKAIPKPLFLVLLSSLSGALKTFTKQMPLLLTLIIFTETEKHVMFILL